MTSPLSVAFSVQILIRTTHNAASGFVSLAVSLVLHQPAMANVRVRPASCPRASHCQVVADRCTEIQKKIDLLTSELAEAKKELAELAGPAFVRVRPGSTRRSGSSPPVRSQDDIVGMLVLRIEAAIPMINEFPWDAQADSLDSDLRGITNSLLELLKAPGTASGSHAATALMAYVGVVEKHGRVASHARPDVCIQLCIQDIVCLACCRERNPFNIDHYVRELGVAFGGPVPHDMLARLCNARWQIFERSITEGITLHSSADGAVRRRRRPHRSVRKPAQSACHERHEPP
jgi:hypothetical protein